MFIENPHKKETYSFRVKPELLKNIKLYAKATEQTVPEILNNLIEEKTKGLHLTNDYLENSTFSGIEISLPPLMEMYNNGTYYKEYDLTSSNSEVVYQIKKVPNNLDKWTNKGYKSNKLGVDHEGISFLLAPELIITPDYLENSDLLKCCLIPIYFQIEIRPNIKTIKVKNIGLRNCFLKIKQASNIELLNKYNNIVGEVKDIIYKYYNITINGDYPTPDHKIRTYNNLIRDLEELSKTINIDFTSQLDEAIKKQTQKLENNILLTDNPYILNNEIDNLKIELEKNNKEKEELKENIVKMEATITDLQKQLNHFHNINDLLSDEKERERAFKKLQNK